jgi:hypothetical protein
MIQPLWVTAGVIVGMLLACVIIPPARKHPEVPQPHDRGVFHTDTGCVRANAIEVPCDESSVSFNLLAGVKQ